MANSKKNTERQIIVKEGNAKYFLNTLREWKKEGINHYLILGNRFVGFKTKSDAVEYVRRNFNNSIYFLDAISPVPNSEVKLGNLLLSGALEKLTQIFQNQNEAKYLLQFKTNMDELLMRSESNSLPVVN